MSPTIRHPELHPDNCSVQWDGASEPVWGTASEAKFWVAMEQRGPWGAKAFTESRLDPAIGARLEKGAAAAGGRALLLRSPKTSGEADGDYLRQVFVAGGMQTGTPWMLQGRHPDPASIADLPFEAMAAGDVDAVRAAAPWLWPTYEAVALICTNSKRDRCCALRGRPILEQLLPLATGQVWECTHTGGHRFAPTGVFLPHGVTVASLANAQDALDTLHALSGREPSSENGGLADLVARATSAASADGFDRAAIPRSIANSKHLRGLAHLSAKHQAADAWVREQHAVDEVFALSVETTTPAQPEGGVETVTVTHRDGRCWVLDVVTEDRADLSVSCGKPAVTATAYFVVPHEG